MATRARVRLRNRRTLIVEVTALDQIRVSVEGEWEETFNREEAWRVTEALDRISTAATSSRT